MKHLQGIKVLDIGSAVAGPYSATLLADLGAEVVKIEKPRGGDMMRFTDKYVQGQSGYYLGVNRGKDGMTLDIRTPRGQEILRRMVADTDVLIQNFRSHRLKEWGLDYESLSAINPRLIYCSITAFGDAKGYETEGGNDIVAQAAAGIMDLTGEADGAPAKAGISVVDVGGAMLATIGILAALHRRSATGKGEHFSLSLLEASYALMPNFVLSVLNGNPGFTRQGSAHPQLAPYQAYQAGDGKYLVVGVFHRNSWAGFCDAIGRPDLLDHPRYKANWSRVEHRAELNAIIERQLAEKTRAEWLALFSEREVLAAPVLSMKDSLDHFRERIDGLIQPAVHTSLGPLQMLRSPLRFDDEEAAPRWRAAPELGEHTVQQLVKLGLGADEINSLREQHVI
jgi:crotonobetainyl-CoA:carnitine CoA-transferase CaiB-like acyl-CoA transferase